MTRFWLIRHGTHDWLGRVLVGRAPGVSLNDNGRQQSFVIAEALAGSSMAAIYSSPMERAMETARPLAAEHSMDIGVEDCLHEIDFGNWTNVSFDQLANDPHWHHWNVARSRARVPGGESMLEVQARIIGGLQRLARAHAGEDVALFSHGDVIKAALCWHLGMSLDAIHKFELEPGGIAVLDVIEGAAALRALMRNDALFQDGVCTLTGLCLSAHEWNPISSQRHPSGGVAMHSAPAQRAAPCV